MDTLVCQEKAEARRGLRSIGRACSEARERGGWLRVEQQGTHVEAEIASAIWAALVRDAAGDIGRALGVS